VLHTVGVVGLGLIGGSIAKGLRPRVLKLIGVDPRVRAPGLIDADGPLSECDLVVLAAPQDRIPAIARRTAASLKPGAVLMDVASVKGPVFEALLGLKKPVEFVSGHPMAGTERRGFEHSHADLLRDRPFLLVPGTISGKRSLQLAERMVRALGARPIWMATPEQHDLAMAYVSHLPHVLAAALLDSIRDPLGRSYAPGFLRRIAGPSFRDATRVAASPEEAVACYLIENRKNILKALRGWRRSLGRAISILRRGDRRELQAYWRSLNPVPPPL
jgi:prephenate dehydrogenase